MKVIPSSSRRNSINYEDRETFGELEQQDSQDLNF
jgi:hypothetical protein